MNIFDYLFENTKNLQKDFLLGPKEKISFATLYSESQSLAGYLKQNLGTGKNIILISSNNSFCIKAYLGILKSGNTVVPLNPAIEPDNLKYIIEQCSSEYAFIEKGNPVRPDNIKIFDEEDLNKFISLKIPFEDLAFSSESVAEIIFTSGSTGLPKGVVITHKNIQANTNSIIQYLNLTEKDIMLVVLPFYYCYGLSLLHTHLRVGGAIAFNNSFIFLGGILRDLNLYKCTGFAGVPSHYQILLRKSESFIKTEFPALRYVTQAGGKLPTVFIKEFINAFPSVKFYVMFGQTEATARLSYLPPDKLHDKIGSIGRGIPDVTLRVVDPELNNVKPGQVGEIIAKGDNIMLGYYKDPELTGQTIKNGWLYTGDLATVDDDGYIFIQSRKKEIIKVGGKRVSPKEIEEVILMIPQIIDCTITGVEDALLGEALKAVVVINEQSGTIPVSKEHILEHCHQHLAKYKIPSIIEFEKSISISATGKKIKSVKNGIN